jgi:hypothetical protein
MGAAVKRAGWLLTTWLITAHASAASKPVHHVCVAQFEAPSDSRVRNEVLAVLSDHDEVAVISFDDATFAGKRIKADPMTVAGRAKIADELGIDVWIDGHVEATEAHLSLSSNDGKRLAVADAQAATASLLDSIAAERMWAAMGPSLSASEAARRALLAQNELARTKQSAREKELDRQREVARVRAQNRVGELQKQRELAHEKQAALLAELQRQQGLVHTRRAEAIAEQERAADGRRQTEMQRLAATAEQERFATAQQRAQERRQAANTYAANSTAGNRNGSGAAAPSWETSSPAAAAPLVHTAPPIAQTTPATQRWLQSQQGYASSSAAATAPVQPVSAPAASAPVQEPLPSAVPSSGAAANGGEVSPATRRWLAAQQQAQR